MTATSCSTPAPPPNGASHPHGSRRPWRLVLALTGLLAAVLGGTLALPAQAGVPTSMEAQFLDRVNADRAAAGLGSLRMIGGLVDIGRVWSSQLGRDGKLSHNPQLVAQVERGVTRDWQRIGENVGYGPSVDALHRAFMASPAHRSNILGDYTAVGIGIVVDGDRVWVTEDFLKAPASVNAAQALPPGSRVPVGNLEGVWGGQGGVRLRGWALDPDTNDAIDVHVYLDGRWAGAGRASGARDDVAAAFPGAGAGHGYDLRIAAGQGWHQVCTYAINVGGGANPALGCRDVLVDDNPRGSLDLVRRTVTGVRVQGWGLDLDTSGPVTLHVYVDGRFAARLVADARRGDVAAAYPGSGDRHGVDSDVAVTPLPHTVCAYALNVGLGTGNPLLGCRTV